MKVENVYKDFIEERVKSKETNQQKNNVYDHLNLEFD